MEDLGPERRVTFLFDVDNTLVDNDRAKVELSARIGAVLGAAGERRFWELYEEVRRDHGLVNIPLLLAHYGDELDADPSLKETERRRLRFALADVVMGFPYREYLYPGAIEAIRKARALGPVAVLSEGDATFQPHKIWRTGLDAEVDGNVLVFDHKLDHLDEMTAAFPADHYVLVEDKPDILSAVKRHLGPRVTTILVRQGKYATVPLTEDPPPDLIFSSIGEFAESDLKTILPATTNTSATRRSAIRALGAGFTFAIGALGRGPEDAGSKKKHKKKKKKCKGSKRKCRKSRQNDKSGGDCPPDATSAASRPFPRQLAYGAIRPNLWSQQQLNEHVIAAYERWKARYLVDAGCHGGDRHYRIALGKPGSDNHGVTVSEGQGYGMVIVALMAGYDPTAQAIFDGLWRFSRAHPSEIDNRLMDWRVPGGEGNDSAFDGDCDIAYGLLLADAQWGSGGPINYRAEFDWLLAGILASTIGPTSLLPMLGDWVDPNGGAYNQYTPRTSDFMLGHFRAFARASGDGTWNSVAAACANVVAMLQANYSPGTGLLPDFVQPNASPGFGPASPHFLEGPHDGAYNYNAGRDPWRLGVDALLNGNAVSAAQAGLISHWAATTSGGNPYNFRSGYHLDGNPLPNSNYFTTFFVAPLGVAAMSNADQQTWLNEVYAAVHDVSEDYFEDTVTLLCLLALTGNFWDPSVT